MKHFEETLKNLDSLISIEVESKLSMQTNSGVWSSSTMTGSELIPADAPDSYKIFRRLYLEFLNRRSIFESLFYTSGAVDVQQYLDAMKEIEINISKLREHYNYKSVALLVINRQDNPQISHKLFSDIYLCDFFTKRVLGVTAKDIYSKNLPPHLAGTTIFDQEWYTSEEQVVKNYPTPNNTQAQPPKIKGEL